MLWQILYPFDASVNRFMLYHVASADSNCFREFLERRQLEHCSEDITTSNFATTLIASEQHRDLVKEHFRQYPVLYVDLKASCLVDIHNEHADRSQGVKGTTYEDMLTVFDEIILKEFYKRVSLFREDVVNKDHIRFFETITNDPKSLRSTALQILSDALHVAYKQRVVVLIDEYDTPIHSAIENDYADRVRFFVLSSS
jgi:hypothetical protein